MSKVIGIDLGTTNSCVAVMEGSKPTVIPNSEGSRTTPSVVGFSENSERLVGQIAKRQALTNASNTIYAVKRLMGCVYNSPEAKRAQDSVPYKVVASSNGDAWLDIRGKLMSPPEVSSMILANIKSTAEEYLGEPVTEAVVTVPAYFNDSQRQATKDAGRIAGLNVLRIINEPTAAAVAYGMDGSAATGPERVAVYDLGGGTFDISILELNGGVFEVKSTNGDTFLGGEDFDNRIVDELSARFERANSGLDLRKDRNALQRLKDAAERAKQELSSSTETEVNIPFIIADAQGPKHLTETITRDQLEALVKDLIERTIQPCATALKDAGLTAAQISQVLLVGGMTRMPAVQKKVKEFFGKEPHKGINPDEVVAIGAAIQGGVLRGEVQDVLLLDVTPLSLGVETAGGLFTKIINKNTTIPCKGSQIFSTASDHQAHVNVHVLQGERELASDNKTLARFELVGIPPAPRGVPQIEVTFDIDANGIVGVSAKDLGSGRVQQVHITSHSGLTEAEIQKALAEAKENQESDKKLRDFAELKNGAEGLIYTTEKSLEEYSASLSEKDRSDIQNDLQRLKKDLASGDEYKIRNSMKQLESSAYRIADAIYGSSQEAPKPSS